MAGDWPELSPVVGGGTDPPAPWHVVGLPGQTKPFSRFTVAEIDGRRALRIEADAAYGNLVHPLPNVPAGVLSWRWRVDQPVFGGDLRRRSGDDAALKVCAAFAMPTSNVPLMERPMRQILEMRAGGHLPTALMCYVWDAGTLPPGTMLNNAFTARIRFIIVGGTIGQWSEERRDLAADFVRAFGSESPVVPPLEGIVIGADSDNTGKRTLAWLDALKLTPAPAR